MTEVPLAEESTTPKTDADYEVDHYVCTGHDPDMALCGTDVSKHDWADHLPNLCIVCEDLEAHYEAQDRCCGFDD